MFYIQKTKWFANPNRVVIIHNGPYETREAATDRMKSLRKNRNTDLAIIEKET